VRGIHAIPLSLSFNSFASRGLACIAPIFDCEAAMVMTIGIAREIFPGERALRRVPEVVEKLIKARVAVTGGKAAPAMAPTSPMTPIRPRAQRLRPVQQIFGPRRISFSRFAHRPPTKWGY